MIRLLRALDQTQICRRLLTLGRCLVIVLVLLAFGCGSRSHEGAGATQTPAATPIRVLLLPGNEIFADEWTAYTRDIVARSPNICGEVAGLDAAGTVRLFVASLQTFSPPPRSLLILPVRYSPADLAEAARIARSYC